MTVEVAKKQWGRRWWRITERKKKKEKKKKTRGGESVGGADDGGDAIGDEWRRWVDRWPVMSGICEKKKTFFLFCFSQIKKTKQTHQPSEWIWFKIKALEFERERERERERAKGYWPIWLLFVVGVVLNWIFVALFCKRFDFLGDKKYSLPPTLFVLYSILRCPKILSCF